MNTQLRERIEQGGAAIWSFVVDRSWVVVALVFIFLFREPIAEFLQGTWQVKNQGFEVSVQLTTDSRKILNALVDEIQSNNSDEADKAKKIKEYWRLLEFYDRAIVRALPQSQGGLAKRYDAVFTYLLEKDTVRALTELDSLYQSYPRTWNIDEVRRLIRQRLSGSPSDQAWRDFYAEIYTNCAWQLSNDAVAQLRAAAAGATAEPLAQCPRS